MTVEFEPKKEDTFCFGAPNSHFFDLLRDPGVKAILGDIPITNDEMDVSEEQSIKLSEYIKEKRSSTLVDWSDNVKNTDMYIEFFLNCGGFTTR
jgi:hypothetical protein|tara:strand:+ start:2460 stop:2741 length:282 start_codon:yes stop_codon:yes gene_type:complete